MRVWLLLFVPVLFGRIAVQENNLYIDSASVQYSFGDEILFSATAHSGEILLHASLKARIAGADPVTLAADIAPGEEGYLLSARWDLSTNPVFPFSSLDYWWEVETASNPGTVSASQTLQYEDDRFAWQRMEKGRVSVSWVEGDAGQADDAADLILLSLGSESADLDTAIPDRIRLYIYSRLTDLQTGLGKDAHGWEGAVSDPASGVMLVAAAPGADGRNALAILLPHETAHLLLGMKWKSAYAGLPAWLTEGLAVGFEMAPRPEMDRILVEAAGRGELLPLSALCQSFPSEEEPALLAYAESRSFVTFLRAKYGLTAVRQAIEAYAAGTPCAGAYALTGRNLGDLEKEWIGQIAGTQKGSYSAAEGLLAAGLGLLLCLLMTGWFLRRRKARKGGGGNVP
jgi:hypothetical protein